MKPIGNSNLKDWSCTKRISGLIRLEEERFCFCGKLEMRNRRFQESRARDCQEIEESRRICCEETDRARQLRNVELSVQQERNPTTVSQLLIQIQDLQNKANPLSDAREFYDICRLIPGMLWVLQETSFESLPAREGPSSALLHNSRNLASSSCDWDQVLQDFFLRNMEEEGDESRRVRQHQLHVLIGVLQPWTQSVILKELILTIVWWNTRNSRSRKCILENSRTHFEFQSWKVNFKTEVCSKSAFLHHSQCIWSKKLRQQSQWTISWHRDRLRGEQISPTAICLIRWLRLQCRSFSRVCISEKE